MNYESVRSSESFVWFHTYQGNPVADFVITQDLVNARSGEERSADLTQASRKNNADITLYSLNQRKIKIG